MLTRRCPRHERRSDVPGGIWSDVLPGLEARTDRHRHQGQRPQRVQDPAETHVILSFLRDAGNYRFGLYRAPAASGSLARPALVWSRRRRSTDLKLRIRSPPSFFWFPSVRDGVPPGHRPEVGSSGGPLRRTRVGRTTPPDLTRPSSERPRHSHPNAPHDRATIGNGRHGRTGPQRDEAPARLSRIGGFDVRRRGGLLGLETRADRHRHQGQGPERVEDLPQMNHVPLLPSTPGEAHRFGLYRAPAASRNVERVAPV